MREKNIAAGYRRAWPNSFRVAGARKEYQNNSNYVENIVEVGFTSRHRHQRLLTALGFN